MAGVPEGNWKEHPNYIGGSESSSFYKANIMFFIKNEDDSDLAGKYHYEIRAIKGIVEKPQRGVGILLISKTADLTYLNYPTFYITESINAGMFTQGDGEYTITVFIQNPEGIWSDAISFQFDTDAEHGWDSKAIWT